ncbi:hypothetical protein DXG01_002464 [Tephrocybe rancida]|nr:hypothetical protein DXG01_002464 [Tephrocybe rancida]
MDMVDSQREIDDACAEGRQQYLFFGDGKELGTGRSAEAEHTHATTTPGNAAPYCSNCAPANPWSALPPPGEQHPATKLAFITYRPGSDTQPRALPNPVFLVRCELVGLGLGLFRHWKTVGAFPGPAAERAAAPSSSCGSRQQIFGAPCPVPETSTLRPRF